MVSPGRIIVGLGLSRCRGHLRIGLYPRRCRCPVLVRRTHPNLKWRPCSSPGRARNRFPALASNLGVSSEALRNWLRQADADVGQEPPGTLTTEECDELRHLYRENHVLKQEREMFKKAAACVAQETA